MDQPPVQLEVHISSILWLFMKDPKQCQGVEAWNG